MNCFLHQCTICPNCNEPTQEYPCWQCDYDDRPEEEKIKEQEDNATMMLDIMGEEKIIKQQNKYEI